MKEIARPDFIQDESHAKAIARNWIRNGEIIHQENLPNFLSGYRSRTRKNFFKMIDSFEELYGNLMVNRRDSKNSRGNSSKKTKYVELAFFSDRLTLEYHKSKLLPIVVMLFDTKTLTFTNPVCAFNLSEHLLARLIMRSEASGLKDIAHWASKHYLFIMEGKVNGTLPKKDFILLTKCSFVPFTYIHSIDESNGLVAKTWIPKSEWSNSMLEKLKFYLEEIDRLPDCNGVFIEDDSFGI
ncbi:TPA: hypothetical protein N2916_004505 [Vibrio parahaemolyticus]|nr:hypothetical protein [Vibrio parahaemolyticus]